MTLTAHRLCYDHLPFHGGSGSIAMARLRGSAKEPTALEIEQGKAFAAWLNAAIRRSGLNAPALADRVGYSSAYIYILGNRNGINHTGEFRKPKERFIRAVAEATGSSVQDGLKAAGFDAGETPPSTPFSLGKLGLAADSQFALAEFLKTLPGVQILGPSDTIVVPLLGKASAGQPIFAEENIRERLPFPRTMISSKFSEDELFAIKVEGDCLTGLLIGNGDTLLCRVADMAEDGEVVVVVTDAEECVAKVFREDDQYRWLETRPMHGEKEIIELDGTPRIIGVMVGLVRA
jgi:SOS-response transcriptional repressor LexA